MIKTKQTHIAKANQIKDETNKRFLTSLKANSAVKQLAYGQENSLSPDPADKNQSSILSASKTINQQNQLNLLGLNEKFNISGTKNSGKIVVRGAEIKPGV